MIEKIDQRPAARDVAAQRADRLRERADLDVHAAVQTEMIDGAASVLAEHAARMRIVDHHDAAEFFGERAEVGQRADVAVHAEDAVGDQQLALRRRQLLQNLARGGGVLVREHLDRRAAQTRAVDDARVIQLVGDDDVLFREDRGDRAGVRGEPALKDDDRLGLLERGEPALELHVDFHGAGDAADGSGSDAEIARRRQRRLPQPRMRRQTQVVVRREIDDLRWSNVVFGFCSPSRMRR